MNRMFLSSLTCLLLITMGQADAADRPPRIEVKELDESPRQQMQREITETLLKKELPKLDWEEGEALSQVLDELQSLSGIKFELQWSAMELVGIDKDSLVKYKAEKRTLPEALSAILAEASADAFDDDRLGFAVREGNLVISTQRETKAITFRRTYNISPLLREPYRPVGMFFSQDAFEDAVALHAWLRGERKAPLTDAMLLKIYKHHHEKMAEELKKLDPDNEVEAKEPPEGQGGLFGDDNLFAERQPFIHPAIEDLIEVIQASAAEPHDWLDETFSIQSSREVLIIRAPIDTHESIEALLNALLQTEIDKQANILKDAHASEQVAKANQCLKDGDKLGAMEHIRQALWIMPDHVPANAMKKLLQAIGDKPKPVG